MSAADGLVRNEEDAGAIPATLTISGRQADIRWLHLSRKQDRHPRGRSITDAFRQFKKLNERDSHENRQGTQIEEPTGRRSRPVEGTAHEAEFPFHQAEVRLRQSRSLDAPARQA